MRMPALNSGNRIYYLRKREEEELLPSGDRGTAAWEKDPPLSRDRMEGKGAAAGGFTEAFVKDGYFVPIFLLRQFFFLKQNIKTKFVTK